MRYVTIKELSNLIRQNMWKIPHDIDCVIGIPRSGMLPATMIALYLNTNLSDIDSFLQGKCFEIGQSRPQMMKHHIIKKVLVVDDSIGAGGSMTRAREKLKKLTNNYDFIFLAPIVTSVGKSFADIFFETIDDLRIFEWNLFHHGLLKNSCLDIDGVLCKDPIIDDDGIQYIHFLQTATPLFTPTAPIGTIISCRLEKYRKQTEDWLSNHNIKYEKLVMLNFPTKEERVKWGQHGEFKGEYYKSSQHILFIESSLRQANIIANIAHKPVICIENNTLITTNSSIQILTKSAPDFFFKVYRTLKNFFKSNIR